MKQEGKKILLVCCDLYFICSVTDPALSNYFRLNIGSRALIVIYKIRPVNLENTRVRCL